MRNKKIDLKQLMVLTMLGVLLPISKFALQYLPNVELVSLLLMVYTYRFGIKTLLPTYIFVGIEIMLYGINIWNIMYLYVWAILVFASLPLKKVRKGWVFAFLSGMFGLLFGTLCSIPYFFAFGPSYAISWIISGLSYDLIHGVANFIVAFILYIPLTNAMDRIKLN